MSGYKSVPSYIREQIANSNSNTFQVGKSRQYTRSEIEAGALSHLGISWTNEGLQVQARNVVPMPEQGRWSKYNVNGWVKVRKDLPKYEKTVGAWETPNFGDPAKGTHTYYSVRDVYPRENWWGQGLGIQIEPQDPVANSVRIGFIVDKVFDRTDTLDRDLLMACSLIRENLGSQPTIIPTDVPVEEWLARQTVSWEILPIGQGEPRPFSEIVDRLNADPNSPRVQRMAQRYDAVQAMHPTEVVVGQGDFSRYFGFKFREDLVALECLDYGNALYLMYDDWAVLSQRSRIDLLSDPTANYDRVIHSDGWERRLASHLRAAGHRPEH